MFTLVYANSDEVERRILKLEVVSAIDPDDLADALDTADNMVNAELVDVTVPNPPPAAIVKAATLFASADYLDNLGEQRDDRDPQAVTLDKKGYRILNGWLNENESSKSPGGYNRSNSSRNRPFYGSKTHRNRILRNRRFL